MDERQWLGHFQAVERRLRGYLFAATANAHEAEDLMQEVSAVLWSKFNRYDPTRPFAAWALGVARIEVLRWRRRTARRRERLSDRAVELLADTAVEAPEGPALGAHLRDCIEALESRAREAMRLRYGDGLSLRDLAARLGISGAAAGMFLMRVRRVLRACVERKTELE